MEEAAFNHIDSLIHLLVKHYKLMLYCFPLQVLLLVTRD